MKNTFAKYWPTLLHLAGAAIAFLNPSVQAYAAGHPGQAVGVLLVWAEVMRLTQSPIGQPGSKF